MKRGLIVLLMVIALAAALGLAIGKHPGYVLIAYDNFRFEASLWATLALLVGVVVLLWVLRLLQRALFASLGWINPWSQQRSERRAQQAAHVGILELAEGRWDAALKHLKMAASREPQPLPYYLGAARAANELALLDERDELLLKALEQDPDSTVAVGLTRARLLLERADYAQARETLEDLHQHNERQAEVSKLLQQLYVQLKDWPALTALLPELRKHKVLPLADLDVLELEVWRARLASLDAPEPHTLAQTWQHVPAPLRKHPELIALYAKALARCGESDQAVQLLAKSIAQNYAPTLITLYGLILSSDGAGQLKKAEQWLQENSNDAVLLLTLARLCVGNQLWGKARDYFERSLAIAPHAQAYSELARLLAQLGENQRSNELFHQGSLLLSRDERFR